MKVDNNGRKVGKLLVMPIKGQELDPCLCLDILFIYFCVRNETKGFQ